MHLTIYADFTCPLSFLAHQRVERLVADGMADVTWRAVVSDPRRPVTGQRLDEEAVRRLRAIAEEWTAAGEAVPCIPTTLSHARPLTAAYAEAVTDGVEHDLRRVVLDALWAQGRNLSDPVDVRTYVAQVMNADHQADPWRRTLSLMPLGIGHDEAVRRAGGTTTRLGGAVTTAGHRRVRGWLHGWEVRGSQPLPLVVTDLGEELPAAAGLHHLLSLVENSGRRESGWPRTAACPAAATGRTRRPVAVPVA